MLGLCPSNTINDKRFFYREPFPSFGPITMFKAILIFSCGLLISKLAIAENHALIIGIGKYPFQPLEGPKYDAIAIKEVLNKKWGFKEKNISTLIDSEATRKNILLSIDNLYDKTSSGDNIFIYYSGHGTSIYDNTIKAPLPETSGALIPYDVAGLKTKQELLDKLIIGRNDLRPRFSKLDMHGRHLFIAIDACYSGNTIRNTNDPEELPTRFMDVNRLVKADPSTIHNDLLSSNDAIPSDIDKNIYPYQNIVYISAASEYEKAQDIPHRLLHKIPTIDNNPHGAFTNTLLEHLYNPSKADLNNNQSVSYLELRLALANRMSERGFKHSPQTLPTENSSAFQLVNQSIFFFDSSAIKEDKKNQNSVSNLLENLGFK